MNADEYRKWLKGEDRKYRATQRRPEKPYRKAGMDLEKMPLGCWVWIGLAALVLFYMISKIG